MSFIRVGQIVGAWGLKGHVKVDPLTDFPEDRFQQGGRLRLDGDWVTIEELRWHQDRPLIKLEGIDTPEAAKALQWHYLEATPDPVELDEDEYLTSDLIGLRVETAEGEVLGKVDDILHMPAHDVLVVGSVMIPAVKQFILDVDLDGGMVLVQLIEGMRE